MTLLCGDLTRGVRHSGIPPVEPIGVVRRHAMRVVSSRVERSRRVAAELRYGYGAGRQSGGAGTMLRSTMVRKP